jgi:photosystem II stability/assembly factor-like uncharacterized protein
MILRAEQRSGTNENLVAVSAVNSKVVWVSGLHGTYARTTDGGLTWKVAQVPGAESLEFRDIYAVDHKTAYLLSVGVGHQGRIYRTDDEGQHWVLKYTNLDTAVVWRALGFWTPDKGVAISDALSGEFLTMWTEDGGWHWTRVPPRTLPNALANEQSPSTSGTILMAGRAGRAWFGTNRGRVLRTTNYGKSWKLSWVPVTRTDSTGVVSIAFRDKIHGIAFGALASSPNDTLVAITIDGGESWEARAQPTTTAISAGTYIPSLSGPTVIVVGPRGASVSRDNGLHWERVDDSAYNSVAFSRRDAGWAVGPNGRITKFGF